MAKLAEHQGRRVRFMRDARDMTAGIAKTMPQNCASRAMVTSQQFDSELECGQHETTVGTGTLVPGSTCNLANTERPRRNSAGHCTAEPDISTTVFTAQWEEQLV